MLLALTSGTNFIPVGPFAQRVTKLGNAGITIASVTLADSGTYKVELTWVDDQHVQHSLDRNVNLVVSGE